MNHYILWRFPMSFGVGFRDTRIGNFTVGVYFCCYLSSWFSFAFYMFIRGRTSSLQLLVARFLCNFLTASSLGQPVHTFFPLFLSVREVLQWRWEGNRPTTYSWSWHFAVLLTGFGHCLYGASFWICSQVCVQTFFRFQTVLPFAVHRCFWHLWVGVFSLVLVGISCILRDLEWKGRFML